MKKSTITILLILAAIGVHVYLTLHYYPVKFGTASGDSVCNINATFNCDSVAASEFASFLQIPMAVWGAATNFILLIFLLLPVLRLTETPEKFIRSSYLFSIFILLSSLAMGGISIAFLSTYCLFCIIAYVLSFISFELIRRIHNEEKGLQGSSLFESKYLKTPLIGLVSMGVIAFVVHKSFTSNFERQLKESGQGSLESFIHRSLKKWESSKEYNFEDSEPLILGDPNAPIVIVEFADFLCPHCQKAAPSLHAFTEAHKDVQLRFFAFPLDGSCNGAIQRKGGGERCRLAKATYCANKNGFGMAMHNYLFKNQSEAYSNDGIDSLIKEVLAKDYPLLTFDAFSECINSEDTHEAILRQAKLGENAEIEGTPTVFVQGKKLEGGQMPPILNGLYKKIKGE